MPQPPTAPVARDRQRTAVRAIAITADLLAVLAVAAYPVRDSLFRSIAGAAASSAWGKHLGRD